VIARAPNSLTVPRCCRALIILVDRIDSRLCLRPTALKKRSENDMVSTAQVRPCRVFGNPQCRYRFALLHGPRSGLYARKRD
jgi:hypothetical protein